MKETRFLPDFCPGTIRASSGNNRKTIRFFGLATLKLLFVLMLMLSESTVLAKAADKRSKTIKVQVGHSGTSYY